MNYKEAQNKVINNNVIITFSYFNCVTVFYTKTFQDKVLYLRYGYKIR